VATLFATANPTTMKRIFIFYLVIIINTGISFAQSDCLFKNPLCFYNTDILSYLQVLDKNQQYEKMTPFLYGSFIDSIGKRKLLTRLKQADFGYSMKRVGVKATSVNKWSLTYQRTIMGTNENFKIDCAVVNDTVRVYIDQKAWNKIFKQ
jgi:hypothetical protein